MSAQSAALQGRSAAESIMADVCTVSRVTGEPGGINPDTGLRDPAPVMTVYAGKCRIQTYEPQQANPDAGEHVYTVQRYAIHLPVSADVAVDDQIVITASVLDPKLVGRSYRAVGLLHKTFATANRVAVDEIVR